MTLNELIEELTFIVDRRTEVGNVELHSVFLHKIGVHIEQKVEPVHGSPRGSNVATVLYSLLNPRPEHRGAEHLTEALNASPSFRWETAARFLAGQADG